jgi:RNA polymerase sigma-70 factor (ECF subfamily)
MATTGISSEADFRKLFDTYKNRVFGYVLAIVKTHHQAEEITQELFIKLWTSRELLAQVDNLDNYIMVMARNRTINFLRKKLSDEKGLQELTQQMSQATTNTPDKLLEDEYGRLLATAIDALSPQRKQVYQLSREKGLNLEQIGQQLGISPNTAKNHLVEALKQIREQLARHGIGMLLLFIMLTE